MNKSERLGQFLDWVQARGDTTIPASDLRLIAVALLDESGGGRVTESHILAASDRHAGVGGDSAVVRVHEVGDLFLKFEEAQRVPGAPPRRTSRNLKVENLLPIHGRRVPMQALMDAAAPSAPASE